MHGNPMRWVDDVTVQRWLLPLALFNTILLMGLSLLWKSQCIGPDFDSNGNTALSLVQATKYLCLTDVQGLWVPRQLGLHLFPYVTGVFTPPGGLSGGTVEYPVLTGLVIWFASLWANTDFQFMVSNAIILTFGALLTTFLLIRLAGRRALWWACAPALVLYGVYNWDIPPVLASVAAIWMVFRGPSNWSVRTRTILAGVLLGIGGGLKLYPLLFVIPLAIWVLWGAGNIRKGRRFGADDIRSAIGVVIAAGGVAVLVNVPFMIIGFKGWLAALQFQANRVVSADTLSIWYWGLRSFGNPAGQTGLDVITVAAGVALIIAIIAILAWGWALGRRVGVYPWLGVSAALLCAYMLLNKVDSLQYILWLTPFFVLLSIRKRWVIAYFVADIILFVGWFQSNYHSAISDGIWAFDVVTQVGIWSRALLLLCLVPVFLRAQVTGSDRNEALATPRLSGRPNVSPSRIDP